MRDPFKQFFNDTPLSELDADFGVACDDILEYREAVFYGPASDRYGRPRRHPATSTRTRRSPYQF
jgi:hypothetical protein